MPTNVIMPQLGESVVEGKVTRWLKQTGDRVSEYEPLLEVSTDKVDTEIPAPAAGILLQILVPEGQTVERGVLLAVIGEAGELPENHRSEARAAEPATVAAEPRAAEPIDESHAPNRISPVVARMAAEHKIDLTGLT